MIAAELQNNLSISQFLETQLQLFKGHFIVTQATMDEEAIHKMRLAIKRIRTIREMKKHIHFSASLDKTAFDTIKSIFKVSGLMRDLQIQIGLMAQYSIGMKTSFTLFMNYFAEKEKYYGEMLDKTIHKISSDQFNNLHASPENDGNFIDNQGIENQSLDFISFQIRKIQKLIVIRTNDENVHELRKLVKQLYYLLQFLNNYFPECCLAKYDTGNLRTIGDNLGHWHDRVVLKERVLEFAGNMGENFILKNPEYQILLYILEDEKRKLLKGLDVNLYLETINLRYLLGERAPEKSHIQSKSVSQS
jgi:CHAD domain-containing protein